MNYDWLIGLQSLSFSGWSGECYDKSSYTVIQEIIKQIKMSKWIDHPFHFFHSNKTSCITADNGQHTLYSNKFLL